LPDSPTIQTDDASQPARGLHDNSEDPETPAYRPSPFFFGLGTLGITIVGETFGAFAYFYYVDFLGLTLVLAALARTIYAVWDALNDPLFSYLSDNTRSRRGRRRPWLLMSIPLLALSFVLIFLVPGSLRGQNFLFWYLVAVTLLYETFLTISGLNYNVLFPELFRTLPDRVRAGAFNRAGLILGLFVGLALTPLVYEQLGFQKMALLYAILGGSMLFLATLRHREDPGYQNAVISGLWPVFREILKGCAFWLYALTLMIFAFAVNLFPFAIPFYSKYALRAEGGDDRAALRSVIGGSTGKHIGMGESVSSLGNSDRFSEGDGGHCNCQPVSGTGPRPRAGDPGCFSLRNRLGWLSGLF
jgi:Na+/melibiose symporter-like transporter